MSLEHVRRKDFYAVSKIVDLFARKGGDYSAEIAFSPKGTRINLNQPKVEKPNIFQVDEETIMKLVEDLLL